MTEYYSIILTIKIAFSWVGGSFEGELRNYFPTRNCLPTCLLRTSLPGEAPKWPILCRVGR